MASDTRQLVESDHAISLDTLRKVVKVGNEFELAVLNPPFDDSPMTPDDKHYYMRDRVEPYRVKVRVDSALETEDHGVLEPELVQSFLVTCLESGAPFYVEGRKYHIEGRQYTVYGLSLIHISEPTRPY